MREKNGRQRRTQARHIRRILAEVRAAVARQGRQLGRQGARQPQVYKRSVLDFANRGSVERPSGIVRRLEEHASQILPMARQRHLGEADGTTYRRT